MKHFIIDGNNLIVKIQSLNKLQKKDGQRSREKLALIVERYFSNRNVSISLHFDGFGKDIIKISRGKIFYSGNLTADEIMKMEIEKSRNPRNIILITSDNNLTDFAVKCSCAVLSSEEFKKNLISSAPQEEEKRRIQEIDDKNEFKKLFGIK